MRLSLDLYDLDNSNSATLTVYSDDQFANPIASDTVNGTGIDGDVSTLSIKSPPASILSATVNFSLDGDLAPGGGTGIDNVDFALLAAAPGLGLWGVVTLVSVVGLLSGVLVQTRARQAQRTKTSP